ncbi:MAG: hypothetical protein AAGB04_21545 [Pseudomonadota bacterium]
MGSSFAERKLEPVEETETLRRSRGWEFDGKAEINDQSSPDFKVGIGASLSSAWDHIRQKNQFEHPVRSLPNDGWEVTAKTVKGREDTMIDGTALAGDELCKLEPILGGNRLTVVGELQANKRAVQVVAKGGNPIGRTLLGRGNREAILGILLSHVLEREAGQAGISQHDTAMVVSKSQVSEE